jgi:hypothetical protein
VVFVITGAETTTGYELAAIATWGTTPATKAAPTTTDPRNFPTDFITTPTLHQKELM